jgi:hypothetical protein
MTKDRLIKSLKAYKLGMLSLEGLITDVEVYSSASNNGKPFVSGALSEEECKCIRYVGGTKWYSNGCKVHPDNDR